MTTEPTQPLSPLWSNKIAHIQAFPSNMTGAWICDAAELLDSPVPYGVIAPLQKALSTLPPNLFWSLVVKMLQYGSPSVDVLEPLISSHFHNLLEEDNLKNSPTWCPPSSALLLLSATAIMEHTRQDLPHLVQAVSALADLAMKHIHSSGQTVFLQLWSNVSDSSLRSLSSEASPALDVLWARSDISEKSRSIMVFTAISDGHTCWALGKIKSYQGFVSSASWDRWSSAALVEDAKDLTLLMLPHVSSQHVAKHLLPITLHKDVSWMDVVLPHYNAAADSHAILEIAMRHPVSFDILERLLTVCDPNQDNGQSVVKAILSDQPQSPANMDMLLSRCSPDTLSLVLDAVIEQKADAARADLILSRMPDTKIGHALSAVPEWSKTPTATSWNDRQALRQALQCPERQPLKKM